MTTLSFLIILFLSSRAGEILSLSFIIYIYMPKRKRTPSPDDEPELNMAHRNTHRNTYRNTPPPPRINAPNNLTNSFENLPFENLPRFFSPSYNVNVSGGPLKKSRRKKKKGVKRRKSVGGKRRRKGKKTKKKVYCYR